MDTWKTFEKWLFDELDESNLSMDEAYRAIAIGIAAVKAERTFIEQRIAEEIIASRNDSPH